jgi:hypothetical protein
VARLILFRAPPIFLAVVYLVIVFFVLDIFLSGLIFDSVIFIFLSAAALCMVRYNFPISGLFLITVDFWFFLPRLIWKNDIDVLQPNYWFQIILPICVSFLFIFPLTARPKSFQSFLPKYLLLFYLLLFVIFSFINIMMGRHYFENRMDASLSNLLLFIPSAILPYLVVELMFTKKFSLTVRIFFLLSIIVILGSKGSKFIIIMTVVLPLLIIYFTYHRTNVLSILSYSLLGFAGLVISFLVGNAVRNGKNLLTELMQLYDYLPLLLQLIFGRLNFLSIANSSLDYFGRFPAEVFQPLLLGVFPRILVPTRLDANNGQWFGELIGLVSSGDNTYVASTIFIDLLLGGNWFLSTLLLMIYFVFMLLLRKLFRMLFHSDHFFIVFLLVNFTLLLEMNFAFMIVSTIKQFFLLVCFVWFPRSFLKMLR